MAFATLYIHFQTCLLEMEELKNIKNKFLMELDYTTSIVADDRQEAQPITAVWRNGGGRSSYDSFS